MAPAGLSQQDYFKTTRAAFDRVAIPKEFTQSRQDRAISANAVEKAFLDANANLNASAIAVTCRDQHIREVRICMNKDLNFRACEEVNKGLVEQKMR